MIINLVSKDNGVGLSTDMALLEEMLVGHSVRRVDWESREMRNCDVAIFLELFNPRLMRYARRTVGIFNLEWFEGHWVKDLPRFTQLWAKSAETHEMFTRRGLKNSTHTGFLSRDLYDPSVKRENACLHLQGHSVHKGTEEVLKAWAVSGLPPLTIVTAARIRTPPPGVTVLGRLSDEDLALEMNKARIHVCPSTTEGWGHYITEALSVKARVVTTDASPMNEHVRPGWGTLVSPCDQVPMRGRMVRLHPTRSAEIRKAVRQAEDMSDDAGEMARKHFLTRNEQFRQTALGLLDRIFDDARK